MKLEAYISRYNQVTKIYFTWLESWGFKLSNHVNNVLVAFVVQEILALNLALMRAQTAKFSIVHSTADYWDTFNTEKSNGKILSILKSAFETS